MIRKPFSKFLLLAAFAAVFAYTNRAEAVVFSLTSFETQAVGSTAVGGAGVGVIVNSGSGITDGAQALRLVDSPTATSNQYIKIGQVSIPVGTNTGSILPTGSSVVSFIVDWNVSGIGGSGYFNLTTALFTSSPATGNGGFTQLNTTTPGQSVSADGAYTITYTLTGAALQNMNNVIATNGTIQLEFFSNRASTRSVTGLTVDNVRIDANVVPEPSTMAIAGLGLLALARRRRQ
jgi:hypothetical protein